MSKVVGAVMIDTMGYADGRVNIALSDLVEFPSFFSVSMDEQVSCHHIILESCLMIFLQYFDPVKANVPNHDVKAMAEVTPQRLEIYMVNVIDNHATRVAHWGLGSKREVTLDILDGMWRSWQFVLHLSLQHDIHIL